MLDQFVSLVFGLQEEVVALLEQPASGAKLFGEASLCFFEEVEELVAS
ncbi:MAG: hypothetical protein R2710_05010 [Acidimicrobiales bacterium]